MANTWRTAIGGAAAIVVLAAGQAAAAEGRTIVLHVANYAEIPPAVLTMAQAHASTAIEAAAVQVVWVNGNEHTEDSVMNALHLNVIFLSGKMTEKKCRAEAVGHNVLGRASHATKRAYIFIDRIVDIAVRNRVNIADVLGMVVAHEVGHLVLRESGHAEHGIMRAQLDVHSTADYFTAEQADVIRSVVMAAGAGTELVNP